MEPGKGWLSRWRRCTLPVRSWLGLSLWLVLGCATGHRQLDEALLADQGSAQRNSEVAERYVVACPDVLEWTVDERPELAGKQAIGPDGRVDVGNLGRARVEGQALPEAARSMAAQAKVAPSSVHVHVAEYNSQQIYLFGEVTGLQRVFPYQGEETLVDLLKRAGGITAGAAPDHVYVVRTQVADGKQPEVFHVALKAILLDHKPETNVRLQPFDQVYVGETRQSSISKCLPPCLRPMYQSICGLHRSFKHRSADTAVAVNANTDIANLTAPPRHWSFANRALNGGLAEKRDPQLPSEPPSTPLPPPRRLDP